MSADLETWKARALKAEAELLQVKQDEVFRDEEGHVVTAGDEIHFSYGIPPVRAQGVVDWLQDELYVFVPGHKPDKCRMADLREFVELFYKVLPSSDLMSSHLAVGAPSAESALDLPAGSFAAHVAQPGPEMGIPVSDTLNLLPEVEWDRFCEAGEFVSVFGWIRRDDGKSDFVLVKVDKDGAWSFNTSSAEYSEEFGKRLGFDGHVLCQRVESRYPGVRAVKLGKEGA